MKSGSNTHTFVFSDIDAQWGKGELRFIYEIIENDTKKQFVEQWLLPHDVSIKHIPHEALQNILQALHIIVGISYYKMYCPHTIKINNYSLSPEQAHFWNTIYTKGLGEFFYKNNIDSRGLIQFPSSVSAHKSEVASYDGIKDQALVLHGGGKDSIVSAQAVADSHVPYDLFTLNPFPIHENVAHVIDKNIISIKRIIDPEMIALSNANSVLKGHIPISAIYSFAASLIAMVMGYAYVIISSERSSNYGNVSYNGEIINHQWSKSEEAEEIIRNYIHTYFSPDIKYFSLLRPYYEIAIAEKFSRFSQFFKVFSSSNHLFKQDQQGTKKRWQYESPKTVFVFIILSAFLSHNELVTIFGDNLYYHSELLPYFEELLGLKEVKPFECVGTPEETMVAMWKAFQREDYSDAPIMSYFDDHFIQKNLNFIDMERKVMLKGDDSTIPEIFRLYI